ncbi:MAG: nucleotidyltransferase family protein [Eubacterium sp.]|nr:nucleotidyltransferase family protein [Eubacterium sp.]
MIKEPGNTEEYLIHLCACALDGTVPIAKPENVDWHELLELAEKHKVVYAAESSIEKLKVRPEDECLSKWADIKNKELVRTVIQTNTLKELAGKLRERGIRYMPLKGSVIKGLYPDPGMRYMSDIDVLIDGEKAGEVRDLLTEDGYTCEAFDVSAHDVYKKYPILNIEIHRSLMPEQRPDLYELYKNGFDHARASEEDAFLYEMTLEELYVFVVAHLYKHYSGGGSGIRYLMDIHVLKTAYQNTWDRAVIDDLLIKAGLSEFEDEMSRISDYWFGDGDREDKLQEHMDYICDSGVYGTMINIMDNNIREKSRSRYFLERMLPPFKSMTALYPWLKYCPVLLPVCWVMRVIKALIVKPKTVAFQFKHILGIDK